MKVKTYLLMLLVALCATSCSDDDDDVVNPSTLVAGTYAGYTSAAFIYSSTPIVTNGESVTMTANNDGTLSVSYTSGTWGATTISDATVTASASGYTISGTGTAAMTSHSTGTTSSYECNLTGTISTDKSDAELVFTLPSVMGGTTITFRLGSAPANEYVAGTYSGYTSAAFVYSSTPIVTDDESVTITANDDGTVSLSYASDTWGTTTISAATVTETTSGYTISGSGTAAMTSHSTGTTASYECNVEGTISADKADAELVFTLPSVMGGTTITFSTGDAPTE